MSRPRMSPMRLVILAAAELRAQELPHELSGVLTMQRAVEAAADLLRCFGVDPVVDPRGDATEEEIAAASPSEAEVEVSILGPPRMQVVEIAVWREEEGAHIHVATITERQGRELYEKLEQLLEGRR